MAPLNTLQLRLSLILASSLGLAYLAICPPFLVEDEATQLASAYALTRGAPRARVAAGAAYREVPRDYVGLLEAYAPLSQDASSRLDRAVWSRELFAPASGALASMEVEPVARSVLPALPGALGVGSARLLGLSASAQLYLARGSALLFYLLAVGSAVALAGPLGWLVFVLALAPGVLLRAACNASALAIDTQALVLLALVTRTALSMTAPRGLALGLVLVAVALAACGPAYVVFLPLCAVLALERVEARRRARLLGVLLLAMGLLAAVPVMLDPRPLVAAGSVWDRLAWLLREPIRPLRLLRRTLFRRGDEAWLELVALPATLTGQLRFVGTFVATVHTQLVLGVAAGALRRALPSERARRIARGALLAALASAAAAWLAPFLAEARVRSEPPSGFAGAPFFPSWVALALALAFGARPVAVRWLTHRPMLRIALPIVLLNVYCLSALLARFHLAADLPFPY